LPAVDAAALVGPDVPVVEPDGREGAAAPALALSAPPAASSFFPSVGPVGEDDALAVSFASDDGDDDVGDEDAWSEGLDAELALEAAASVALLTEPLSALVEAAALAVDGAGVAFVSDAALVCSGLAPVSAFSESAFTREISPGARSIVTGSRCVPE
jgi:hypothetical protein